VLPGRYEIFDDPESEDLPEGGIPITLRAIEEVLKVLTDYNIQYY
jgi:hypothetical protein